MPAGPATSQSVPIFNSHVNTSHSYTSALGRTFTAQS